MHEAVDTLDRPVAQASGRSVNLGPVFVIGAIALVAIFLDSAVSLRPTFGLRVERTSSC